MTNAYPREVRERVFELVIKTDRPMTQVARELGISTTGLQRWVAQARVDGGDVSGATTDEHTELVRLRRENRRLELEVEILKRASTYFVKENMLPKQLSDDREADGGEPSSVQGREGLSDSEGFLRGRDGASSPRAIADAQLVATITAIHHQSRATYGAPRIHAELRIGIGVRCGRKRVARLMRSAGLSGISHRRKGGESRPLSAPHEDLVWRRFVADRPNQLWATDITEHPTRTGKLYCAAVLYVFSRRIVGRAIADHIRAELVVDTLEMAREH